MDSLKSRRTRQTWFSLLESWRTMRTSSVKHDKVPHEDFINQKGILMNDNTIQQIAVSLKGTPQKC